MIRISVPRSPFRRSRHARTALLLGLCAFLSPTASRAATSIEVAEARLVLPEGKRTEVKSRITSEVTQLVSAEGVPVHEGDVLAEVDLAKLERELEGARRTLQSAQSERRQLVSGQNRGAPSSGSLTNSTANRITEAEIAEADASRDLLEIQTRLATAAIRAPKDGYVAKHLFAVGAQARKNKLFLYFAEAGTTRLELSLPAEEGTALAPGTKVTVRSAADPAKQFSARVEGVTANGDRTELRLQPLGLPFLAIGESVALRIELP